MLGQFLLAFREGLEASLIISIIIAFLAKEDHRKLIPHVWHGVIASIVASIGVAIMIGLYYGGLSNTSAKLFEGIAALVGATVLTYMILWMAKNGKHINKKIEAGVQKRVDEKSKLGILAFSFLVVFREGFETVLFLIPFGANDLSGTIIGGSLGILAALVLAYLVFKIGIRLNIRKFFYFTSLLLIFLAAGLAGYGVHELMSYQAAMGGDMGWLSSLAYNLDLEKGSLFHHKGAIGSIFAVVFGYSSKMEWGRVIIHLIYLSVFVPFTIHVYRNKEVKEASNSA